MGTYSDNLNIKRLKDERDFHDRSYSNNLRKRTSFFYTVAVDALKLYRTEICQLEKHQSVLEIAGGPRTEISRLMETKAKVFGIDLSHQGLSETQNQLSDMALPNLFAMNAESSGFKDQVFDLVCGTAVLHHLNLNLACKEIKRVLKPEGKAIFLEPLGHNPLINLFRRLTPKIRTVDEQPFRLKDIELLQKQFSQCEVIPFCMFNLLAAPFYKFKFFPWLLSLLTRLDQLIFDKSSLKGLNKYAWICVLKLNP
jgi:SAM-dependent methyltransferase